MTSSLLQAEYIPTLKKSGLVLHSTAAAWWGHSWVDPLSQAWLMVPARHSPGSHRPEAKAIRASEAAIRRPPN